MHKEKTYCIHIGQLLSHEIFWEAREPRRPAALQFLFLFQAEGDAVGKPICSQVGEKIISSLVPLYMTLFTESKMDLFNLGRRGLTLRKLTGREEQA